MIIDNKWPYYFSELLIKGDPESNAAICSLWTLKEAVTKGIPLKKYAIAGNMYYNDGISYMLRTVLSNPNIRYIILCGVDITKTGESLARLFEHGMESHRIKGTAVEIDANITEEAVELVRKNVELIDMRGVVDPQKISEKLFSLQEREAFAQPQIFPLPVAEKKDTLTSEKTGMIARGKTVAEAWYKILNLVMKFGTVKKSQHSSDQKELVDLVAVVEDEDPDNPEIEKWLFFTKNDLENYYPQIMTGIVPEGTEYTYGNRLRDHGIGKNQIDYIINDLMETKYSRRAVAVTWNHEKDMRSKNPPCWVVVQTLVQEGTLYLTCYIRSNDMYAAWPLNAFGLRKMQKEIAGALDTKIGPLTTVSCSAHIYWHDWNKAKEVLEKYSLPKKFTADPRGNFVISLDREQQKIIVDYYTSDMKKAETFSFALGKKTSIEIYSKLSSLDLISQIGHAADIGVELAKAEIALRHGLKYVQDEPLDLDSKI